MIKNFLGVAVILAMSLLLPALELPSKVKFDPSGSFKIAGIDFLIQAYSEKSDPITNQNWKNCNSKPNSGGLEISGAMQVGDQVATVSESIRPLSEDAFQLEFLAKFASEVRLGALHGCLKIPNVATAVRVDGKPVALPAEYDKQIVYSNRKASELSLTTAEGTEIVVSGTPLNLTIQDDRRIGAFKISADRGFLVRLGASPASGLITNAKLALDFKVSSVGLQKLDLSQVANAGFSDEVADDGQGGWTDQGSNNDLRSIQPGEIKLGALAFDILDPGKNHGRSCIVLSGSEKKFIAEKVAIPLPVNQAKAINLLHASAWEPKTGETLGVIIAEYADGSVERIPIHSKKDCGNWWIKSSFENLENGKIAWSGENSESAIGLYASSFSLSKPGPVAIHLEVTSPYTIWMIAGITLSNRAITLPSASLDKPLVMKENYQWKPLTFTQKIIKGGVLDFSAYVEAPAGKYGFIRPTPEGRLSFEKAPEKPLKLYGPNLVHSACFLDKATADQLVEYLVYCGYNTVRFHHQDRLLVDKDAKDSLTIDLEQLDKLDYLFFRLKESGIYITTDLFASRRLKPGDNIPECDSFNGSPMKRLLHVSRAAMENWKEFARRLMNHRNPYTGLTWGEDPALWCINLVNEELLYERWDTGGNVKKLYKEAFRKYCAEKGLTPGELSNSNLVFRRFLHELQTSILEEQIRFVKEELKLKCLVTSLNNDAHSVIPATLIRPRFDLVDNHIYADHPSSRRVVKVRQRCYKQASQIKLMADVPIRKAPTRIPGKAFIVTEFNYCNPNIYRAEGGPLFGSYAALQGWDALYRFAWSHSAEKVYKLMAPEGFDAIGDPLAQFSDRIAIAMFRRGDVEEAQDTYAYVVPENCIEQKLYDNYPSAFRNLGLITKVGAVPEQGYSLPPNVKLVSTADSSNPDKLTDQRIASLWKQANDKKLAVSSTGQHRLDANAGTFAVATPRVASATLGAGDLVAGALTVRNASCFQTVAAISLDGKNLEESGSILVFQLTNLANTGQRFTNASRRVQEIPGELPLLVQKGSAVIELASARPCKVEALNCDGEPYGTVEGTYANGVYRFKADTARFEGGVMVYHVTR